MSGLEQEWQDPSAEERNLPDEDGVSLAVLGQQMLLAERQRSTIAGLAASLEELRKAAGTTPAAEKLLLLRRLRDSLKSYEER